MPPQGQEERREERCCNRILLATQWPSRREVQAEASSEISAPDAQTHTHTHARSQGETHRLTHTHTNACTESRSQTRKDGCTVALSHTYKY